MPEEVMFANHALKHICSFQSMDFTTSIIMKLRTKKFSCVQNKCNVIVASILLPYEKKYIVKELDEAVMCMNIFRFTNQTDLKIVPVIFMYVRQQKVMLTKILEFANLHGETSDLLPEHFFTCLQMLQLWNNCGSIHRQHFLKFGMQKRKERMSSENFKEN
jgi:hypothetical protein